MKMRNVFITWLEDRSRVYHGGLVSWHEMIRCFEKIYAVTINSRSRTWQRVDGNVVYTYRVFGAKRWIK